MINKQEKSFEIIRPTLFTTLFSFLNYGIIFLTQIMIANYFGNSNDRDVYLIALTIPSYITSILIGSIPPVFLPTLIELRNKSIEKSWQFAENIFYFCALGSSIIVIICILFAKDIILLITPEISSQSLAITIILFTIITPTITLNLLTGLLGNLYYSNYEFLLPSLTPIVNSIITFFCILALNQSLGIYSLAIGSLLGSMASVFSLSPILKKNFSRSFHPHDPNLFNFLYTTLPLIVSGTIYQSSTIVQRRIASTLPVGSISSLGYCTQIITVLSTLLSGGIAVILFPMMSNAWSQKDFLELRKIFSHGIIIVLAFTIPFIGFFIFFSQPLINILFERGAFTASDTIIVANLLTLLSGTLVFNSLGNIIAKGFYFSKNTLWMAFQETIILVVYLFLGFRLASAWALSGLALANTICSGLSIFCSYLFVRFLLKGVNSRQIFSAFYKIIICTILSSFISYIIYSIIIKTWNIFGLLLTIVLNFLIYFFVLVYVLKIPEVLFIKNELFNFLLNIFQHKQSDESI